MVRASAKRTSKSTLPSCIRPIRDPSIEPPVRFERIPKEVGSRKLVLGEWVVVQPGDVDAIQKNGPAQSTAASGG